VSPTGLTLRMLRDEGYQAAVVERWVPGKDIRVDLFGFGDVLAVHPRNRGFLIVQTTSLANVSSRLTKAKGKAELAHWLQAGGAFEVHGWVNRNGRWSCKRVGVEKSDMGELADVVLMRPRRKKRKSRWDSPEGYSWVSDSERASGPLMRWKGHSREFGRMQL
jgi:hypothetical protein